MPLRPFIFWLAFGLAATVPPARAEAPRVERIAGLQVAVWLPSPASPGPFPVILFSHGFHGCNTQSKFLVAGLAAAGYAVFVPNHHDAACHNLRAWLSRPDEGFRAPRHWSEATYADRARDLTRLLDALLGDPGRFLDQTRIGLIGHSLGGYTVLGLAGAWPTWRDPRIKAVLALSPYVAPFIARHALVGLAVPVMYQGGTRDFGVTPALNKGGGAYDQTPVPKYYVEFDGAGHFAWTDLRATFQPAILAYASAFFDHHLRNLPFPEALAHLHPGLSRLRIAANPSS